MNKIFPSYIYVNTKSRPIISQVVYDFLSVYAKICKCGAEHDPHTPRMVKLSDKLNKTEVLYTSVILEDGLLMIIQFFFRICLFQNISFGS